ncbi:hypothetical protein KY348_03130 [Candidatus Woesearchaeota archaeon]|nr:hypothetical protein [Candidatus Woesearchaeota archaeon]
MVFDLSLDLKIMKEMIGWDDSKAKELFFEYDGKGYHGTSPDVSVYECWKENGKNMLPYKFIYNSHLNYDNLESCVVNMCDYFKFFYSRLLNESWLESQSKAYSFAPLISEPFTNTILHGSGDKKGKHLTIETYHPQNPKKMILRMANPEAKPWDYKEQVKRYLEFRKLKQGPTKEGIGRGGFWEFSDCKPLISYDNEGKDWLALIEFK